MSSLKQLLNASIEEAKKNEPKAFDLNDFLDAIQSTKIQRRLDNFEISDRFLNIINNDLEMLIDSNDISITNGNNDTDSLPFSNAKHFVLESPNSVNINLSLSNKPQLELALNEARKSKVNALGSKEFYPSVMVDPENGTFERLMARTKTEKKDTCVLLKDHPIVVISHDLSHFKNSHFIPQKLGTLKSAKDIENKVDRLSFTTDFQIKVFGDHQKAEHYFEQYKKESVKNHFTEMYRENQRKLNTPEMKALLKQTEAENKQEEKRLEEYYVANPEAKKKRDKALDAEFHHSRWEKEFYRDDRAKASKQRLVP